MARINSNIPSLIARANLNRANDDLQVRLQRLSTGLRINRGADDPAGLIISERLRSEISGLNQAVDNSSRASSVISTTEGALSEVSDLLSSIRALVVQAANTGAVSDEERKANQLQIDSAIQSITRISNSASFGGLKLLNGSLDYTLSGVDTSKIAKTTVTAANFAGRNNIQVNVQVLGSAQTGNLFLSTPNGSATFPSATTLEIQGSLGVQSIEIASGQPLTALVNAINNFTAATGVSASFINGNSLSGVQFSSTQYGSKQFVSVNRLGGPPQGGSFFRTYKLNGNYPVPGTFSFSGLAANLSTSNRDEGRDVTAIINGNLAQGDGLKVSLQNQTSVAVEFQLAKSFATTPTTPATSFYITGGGALYQLGSSITSSQQTNISLQSVAASRIGGTLINGELQFLDSIRSGGSNALQTGNYDEATKILDTTIDEISSFRGRLGAFERNTLQTNIRSLQSAVENLTASESRIRDADFAFETAHLTRAQVLTSAATSVLQIANSQSQNVLQLLRQ